MHLSKKPAKRPNTIEKPNDTIKFTNWYPACFELLNDNVGVLLSLPAVKIALKIAANTHINILSIG